MTQDIRDLRPRGRLLENVAVLRGTARHDSEEQVYSWKCWIASAQTSEWVLGEMRRAS